MHSNIAELFKSHKSQVSSQVQVLTWTFYNIQYTFKMNRISVILKMVVCIFAEFLQNYKINANYLQKLFSNLHNFALFHVNVMKNIFQFEIFYLIPKPAMPFKIVIYLFTNYNFKGNTLINGFVKFSTK